MIEKSSKMLPFISVTKKKLYLHAPTRLFLNLTAKSTITSMVEFAVLLKIFFGGPEKVMGYMV